MNNLKLLFFLLPFLSFSQELITKIINSSGSQGIEKSCGITTCFYFENSGRNVYFENSGVTAGKKEANARYLFNHPSFTNDKITKIILELSIKKSGFSTDGDAIMRVKVPESTCNDTISWLVISGDKKEDLYNCNSSGNIVFKDGIGTSSRFATTENLLIYDKDFPGFPSSTIQYFDSKSNSFTLAFTPFVGNLEINSVKVHVTYEDDNPPSIPIVNGSSNSTSSINLSWNSISTANSYDVFTCGNQKIATVTSNSYTISNLNPDTAYSYKVRATNSNGNSSFSSCKSITTQQTVVSPPRTPVVNGSSNSISSINLSWNTIANATSYEVYNCNGQFIKNTISNNYTITGLSSGTYYTYKVRAKNSGGNSSFSSCLDIKTLGCIEDINLSSIEIIENHNASNSISISNSVSESNSTVTLKAGSVISLQPNAHLKSGSNILLKIEECNIASTSNKEIVLEEKEVLKNQERNVISHYKFDVEVDISNIVSVFPNPTINILKINSNITMANYVIINSLGRSLLNEDVSKKEVIVVTEKLPQGVYIVRVTLASGEVIVKKIIKN